MPDVLKILLVEDNGDDAALVATQLDRSGIVCEMARVETEPAYLRALVEFSPDLILSDLSLPEFNGMAAMRLAREKCPNSPFIFVSGTIGEEVAIESMKNGATDYVLKNNLGRLANAVTRAVEHALEHSARREAERRFEEAQGRFRDLFEFAPDAMVITDNESNIKLVNTRAEIMFGYPRDELIGESVEILIPRCSRGVHVRHHMDCRISAHAQAMGDGRDLYGRRKDGTEFPTEINLSPMLNGTGQWFLSAIRDITDRRMQEQKIARLNRIHAVLSGINSVILRSSDRNQLYHEACRIAVEKGNFRMAAVMLEDTDLDRTRCVAQLGDEKGYLDKMVASRSADLAEGRGSVGAALRSKQPAFSNDMSSDPDMLPWRELHDEQGIRSVISLPLIITDRSIGVLALFSCEANIFTGEEVVLLSHLSADVSFALDHIEKEERLDYIAFHDQLTGLPNRKLFLERLGQNVALAQRNGSQVAVVIMDVERFRQVNESLGRQTGDALLRVVADRLSLCAGGENHIGHIGADVFALMIPNAAGGDSVARFLTEKLTAGFVDPVPIADGTLQIGVRSGVAIFPEDGKDAETLSQNAESAMKSAKSSGERFVFYSPPINSHVAARLTLENRLRRAILLRHFVLHYQPKIDLQSNRVVGIEALIRWNDPDTGLISPGEFIPILEDTGMIDEVGHWALERALVDARTMRGVLPQVPRIAVNISPLQLRKGAFVENLWNIVAPAPSGDHGLDLEITESVIMHNIEDNIPKLRAARDMSFGIAIDDFGTGYSSLSYIAKLPITMLKIDRTFVMSMTKSPADLSIVSSVISLAHALGLKVVAEGVETPEQSQILAQLRCDEVQGYLYCRPQPLQRIIRLLVAGGGCICSPNQIHALKA